MTQDEVLHSWKEGAEKNLAIGKELYLKATADYAKLYFSKIEEYALWLIKQY